MQKVEDYGRPIACRINTPVYIRLMEIVRRRMILRGDAVREAVIQYIEKAEEAEKKYESEL